MSLRHSRAAAGAASSQAKTSRLKSLPQGSAAVHVGYAVPRAGLPAPASFQRWVEAALRGAKRRKPGELAIRIVDTDEGRALNRDYRGKDYATNVLTFDYARKPMVMADIVLCGPVVLNEAVAQRKTLKDHYAHLLVHGTLHAQGYEHETHERDALEMEALEILLLGSLGIPNPY